MSYMSKDEDRFGAGHADAFSRMLAELEAKYPPGRPIEGAEEARDFAVMYESLVQNRHILTTLAMLPRDPAIESRMQALGRMYAALPRQDGD